MSRLIVSETDDRVQLSWLGLRAAFAKDANLPHAWRELVAAPSNEAAICDWLAAFGLFDEPSTPLPGNTLHLVADGAGVPLFAS